MIDNTRSIVERAPAFAKVYLAEKALLLEVLRDGDATLLEMAHGVMSPNDRVEGHDAAISRRVPSHDGLCTGAFSEKE